MTTETEEILREFLAREEGRRDKVYDDASGQPIVRGSTVSGFPTIGIGRELSRTGLRQSEIDQLFSNDVEHVESQAEAAWYWFSRLAPARQAALLSMVFQMGIEGTLRFKRMLAAVQAGRYDIARIEGLDSDWARQTPGRARRVLQMLELGVPIRR